VTYSLFPLLSESRLYPSTHSLKKVSVQEACQLAFLYLMVMRILLDDPHTRHWAKNYAYKTSKGSPSFKTWRMDGTDLYALIYALETENSPLEDGDEDFRDHLPLDASAIHRWLRAVSMHEDETLTRRLMNRLDQMFRIRDSSLKAIRRLVLDWPDLSSHERRLVVTRLLQFVRTRASRGEIRPKLEDVAKLRGWEIGDACNPEDGHDCGGSEAHDRTEHPEKTKKKKAKLSFLQSLAAFGVGVAAHRALTKENASSGATAAGSVATVVGGLGAGFDDDYSKSVYPAPSKPKKKVVLRR